MTRRHKLLALTAIIGAASVQIATLPRPNRYWSLRSCPDLTRTLGPKAQATIEKAWHFIATTLGRRPLARGQPPFVERSGCEYIPTGPRIRSLREVFAPGKPFYVPNKTRNVALRKPVILSDGEPVIGNRSLVTDGNKGWKDAYVYVEMGPGPQFAQIDLQGRHIIYAICVWHEYGRGFPVYHDVVIQVADDPGFTKNVRTLFNNDHDNSSGFGAGQDLECPETEMGLVVAAHGTEARYVRLHSDACTSHDLNRYLEVEVFGLPGR